MEDHALERVPDGERETWLKITWNTVGLITTLVIMFFGAVVCFVAGVKIALLAGIISFSIGRPRMDLGNHFFFRCQVYRLLWFRGSETAVLA